MNIVDEIKQKLDIVEVIGQYIKLQKSGRNFKALCPFHAEKTPSFYVFPDRQSWHCFGACGTGGDIFSFIMKKEGVDFSQALRLLAEKANVTIEFRPWQNIKKEQEKQDTLFKINEITAEFFHFMLIHSPEGESARNYIKKRELSNSVVEKFQLGFAPEKWDGLLAHLVKTGFNEQDILSAGLIIQRETGGYYDRFRNRLIFPIRDVKGRVIGFGGRALDDSTPKYLNSPQTPIFDKSSVLYGIDKAQNSIRAKDSAVITEGYMDTLAAHQFGFENTIASLGTAITGKQIAILHKFSKNIIVALDADTAGLEATSRSISTINENIPVEHWMPWTEPKTYDELVKYEVHVVQISGGKDPDEIIRKSPETWEKLLKQAQPIIDFTLKREIANISSDNISEKSSIVSKYLPVLAQVDDPVRRAHYVQKFASLLQLDERFIRDALFGIQSQTIKSRAKKLSMAIKNISVEMTSSRNLEEYCLALLLQFPDLHEIGATIQPDYFEHSEIKDILIKWLENRDVNWILDNIDPTMYDYYNYLLTYKRYFAPSLSESKQDRQIALKDCINRLQERYVRNLELKKKAILAEEKNAGSAESQLSILKEHGIRESEELKDIFKKRGCFFTARRESK